MDLNIVDEADLDTSIDDIVTEILPLSKQEMSLASVPTQDRWGNPRWIRTKMCYCLPSKLDSCNIMPRKTTECPSQMLDKTQRSPGIWLYATNPDFGKAPEELEVTEPEGLAVEVVSEEPQRVLITSA